MITQSQFQSREDIKICKLVQCELQLGADAGPQWSSYERVIYFLQVPTMYPPPLWGLLLKPGAVKTLTRNIWGWVQPKSSGAFLPPQNSDFRVDPRFTFSTQKTEMPRAFRHSEEDKGHRC